MTQAREPVTTAEPPTGPGGTRRIHELDALRGFAMTGIVFMNILLMTGMPRHSGASADHSGAAVFEQLFEARFFPIFSFLFGLSFALFLDGAAQRHDRPRLLLVRRLLVLGVIGIAHALLQPGEVLRFYALFGLLALLPASYLPRRALLGLGAVLVVVPLALSYELRFIGGLFAIPGLFLLGLAAGGYGVAATLDRRGRQLAVFFGVALVTSVLAVWWQYAGGVGPARTIEVQIVGFVVAAMYASGFLLLLRTPAGRPLSAVFAPIGRMALTNYLLATLLILAGNAVLHLERETWYAGVVLLGVAIGAVQAVLSRAWMGHFRYGPAEWVWRCLTWWQLVPLRRPAG